jgi:hypothetical protein
MTTLMDCVRMLRSPDNKKVLEGVEDLRVRGWLEDGSLNGLPFCHAQLQGADLFKANLSDVDLHQAHMENVDLSLAMLHGTHLARADLRRANFDRASLDGADLLKAKLQGAINLKPAQLMVAKRLWGATLPGGEPYDGRYNLPGDIELARWGGRDTTNHAAMAEFYMIEFDQYMNGQKEAALLIEHA